VLIFGLTVQYIDGKLGLIIVLLCLFANGIGVSPGPASLVFAIYIQDSQVDLVLSPVGTYTVDVLHDRSAEVMAAGRYLLLLPESELFICFPLSSAFRNVFCALASVVVLPSIETIGMIATNSITAAIGWLTFVCVRLTRSRDLIFLILILQTSLHHYSLRRETTRMG